MYPTISHLLEDFFGVFIPLPIRTFGFFMALAFLFGGWITYRNLKYREGQGIFQGEIRKIPTNVKSTPFSYISNAIFGFVVGYKLLYMVSNWVDFSTNPELYVLSWEGSWIGGIAMALFMIGVQYYDDSKIKGSPKTEEQTIFPSDMLGDMIIIAAIVGILGSKVFTWIEDIDGFLKDPMGALLSFSGLTFYGGMICATLALLVYFWMRKLHPVHMVDSAAPALVLGYGVGRLGCHFSGDGDWGIVNTAAANPPLSFLPDWLWAYQYPNNVIEAGVPIEGCVGQFCRILPEAVYPTSVYEFFMAFTIFTILMFVFRRFLIPGLVVGLYLLMNGLERFLIEFIRVNNRYDFLGMQLSQAQIIALGMMLSGVVVITLAWFFHKNKQQKQPSMN